MAFELYKINVFALIFFDEYVDKFAIGSMNLAADLNVPGSTPD